MRVLAAVLSALTLVVAVAAGSAAAATPVGGSFAASPAATVSHWTAARRAAAVPMSVLPLTSTGALAGYPRGDAGGAEREDAAVPSAASVEGVDTGDPTVFPNRANGWVLGEFAVEGEPPTIYQCSGSVIESLAGDVVLTAGHCVIDPETGAVGRNLVFIPGYREGAGPYGAFAATNFVTTPEWASSAGTAYPDESGDLAMLVMAPSKSTGVSVQATVGALGIGFERAREETYTEWGYPAESPYDGEVLYSHSTPYAGSDQFYQPQAGAPIRIASDFTEGASGGPWTIGPTTAPTVLSVTDYLYEADPGHLYGAYFGAAARHVYEAAAGVAVPPAPAVEPTVPAAPTPAPTPAASPPPAAPTASTATDSLRIVSSRALSTHGEATVVVHVGGPGTLRLRGPAVRTVSVGAEVAGNYRLAVKVKPGSPVARKLLRRGSATVGVWVRFSSSLGVHQASRLVRLSLPR